MLTAHSSILILHRGDISKVIASARPAATSSAINLRKDPSGIAAAAAPAGAGVCILIILNKVASLVLHELFQDQQAPCVH